MNKLILHCHTSGCNYNSADVVGDYQIISIGAIVISEHNKKIAEFEKYIKYSTSKKWDSKAETIHKISIDELEQIGEVSDTVFEDFILFLSDHFDVVKDNIQCIGYNIDTFTLMFIKKFIADIPIKFSYFNIDLRSLYLTEQNKIDYLSSFVKYFSNNSGENINSIELCKIFHIAYRYYVKKLGDSDG